VVALEAIACCAHAGADITMIAARLAIETADFSGGDLKIDTDTILPSRVLDRAKASTQQT
jgi:hypothetical protein